MSKIDEMRELEELRRAAEMAKEVCDEETAAALYKHFKEASNRFKVRYGAGTLFHCYMLQKTYVLHYN